jgi:hypothetical protein
MRSVCSARGGLAPLFVESSMVARVCVIGLAVVTSGCAATKTPSYAGVQNSQVRPVAERPWTVEIEEDGKPAQLPPVRRMRPEEDDPSQPWSPNYGRRGATPQETAPAQLRTAWPKPIETAAKNISGTASSAQFDADALIAKAVNTHEMRRP